MTTPNFISFLCVCILCDNFQERTTDDSKESESFKELLTARTQEFIEEILAPHFGGLITFVKEAEVLQERGQIEGLRTQERESTDFLVVKTTNLLAPYRYK